MTFLSPYMKAKEKNMEIVGTEVVDGKVMARVAGAERDLYSVEPIHPDSEWTYHYWQATQGSGWDWRKGVILFDPIGKKVWARSCGMLSDDPSKGELLQMALDFVASQGGII